MSEATQRSIEERWGSSARVRGRRRGGARSSKGKLHAIIPLLTPWFLTPACWCHCMHLKNLTESLSSPLFTLFSLRAHINCVLSRIPCVAAYKLPLFFYFYPAAPHVQSRVKQSVLSVCQSNMQYSCAIESKMSCVHYDQVHYDTIATSPFIVG